MSDYNLSANMSLPIPTPLEDSGPDYALNLNASLVIIDSHDHTPGNGVQLTPDSLNINAELPFGNNDATELRTVRFQAQSSVPAVNPDLLCLYAVGADLYYNDANGNAIRMTQSGAVAGAAGTITGLPSGTASASYSAGSGKFVFQSASLTGADIDGASIIIREKVASGKAVTLNAPAGLAADYDLNFPAALPIATKFMSLDASGNIAASWAVDNSTIEINSNTVRVKDLGITGAKLAAASVSTSKLDATLTAMIVGVISSEITFPTDNADAVFTHGLGAVPSRYSVVLRCKTFDVGYTVGSEVNITSNLDGDGARITTSFADATNIVINSNSWSSYYVKNQGAPNGTPITPASWKIVMRAWL